MVYTVIDDFGSFVTLKQKTNKQANKKTYFKYKNMLYGQFCKMSGIVKMNKPIGAVEVVQ